MVNRAEWVFDSSGSSPPHSPLVRARCRHPIACAPLAGPRSAFTLIEAALVLSLTGVLLAAFVPTFLRHVRTSKLAEATEQLGTLHRQAAAYYAREHAGAALARHCLPASAGPYPSTPSPSPVPVDFADDSVGAPTWIALGQTGVRMLRYAYEVVVAEPGCRERAGTPPAIWFRAHGDLDGDGEPSLIERAATPKAGVLAPVGPLRIVARTE